VNDSLNIVGAGQNTTIIQGGTTNLNGVDLVIAVNEDISPITDATASISNLTIRLEEIAEAWLSSMETAEGWNSTRDRAERRI